AVAPVAPEFNDSYPADDAGRRAAYDNGSGRNGCLVYGSADYLLWHISPVRVPSIVNTVPVGVLTVTTSDSNADANGNTTATGLNQVVHFFPVSIAETVPSVGS